MELNNFLLQLSAKPTANIILFLLLLAAIILFVVVIRIFKKDFTKLREEEKRLDEKIKELNDVIKKGMGRP